MSSLRSILVEHKERTYKDRKPTLYAYCFRLHYKRLSVKPRKIPIHIVLSKIWCSPVLSPSATRACAMARPHAVLALVHIGYCALQIWRPPGNRNGKSSDPRSIILSLTV